ncbi:MAG TPA: hypothetical protein VLD85_03410 [Anaeromyxobacteraceae bacterium]|nr:hypothetical protein [Anaeromyxobacteraceae bacterium]
MSPRSEKRLSDFAAVLRARAREKGRRAPLRPEEVEAVATRVALLDLAAEEMGLYRPRPRPEGGGLTAREARLLEPAMRRLRASIPRNAPDPHAAYLAHLAKLRADSLSVEEAAKLLGVNPSRIRQRLGGKPRTLLGMKVGRSWRVFRYQLEGDRLVPNLEKVIAAMPRGRDPTGEHNWLTLPDPDLEVGDRTVSPITWLRMGRDPEPVIEVARWLGVPP